MDKNRISKVILFLFIAWVIINAVINSYISIIPLFGAVMATIVVLGDFVKFIKIYRNKFLVVFVIIHCMLTFLCLLKFRTYEYANVLSAYLNVVVLENTEYQMISKPGHSGEYMEDINAPYSLRTTNNTKDAYRYVIKDEGTIDDKMVVISNFLYKIEKYELSHGNSYRLYLKVGKEEGILHVTIENYSQFAIVKFR